MMREYRNSFHNFHIFSLLKKHDAEVECSALPVLVVMFGEITEHHIRIMENTSSTAQHLKRH